MTAEQTLPLWVKSCQKCGLSKKTEKERFQEAGSNSQDWTTLSLDGRIELEITFEEKIKTTVYVKMDAYNQLLLCEGCDTSLVSYPGAQPWEERKRDSHKKPRGGHDVAD